MVKCVQDIVSEAREAWPKTYEYPLKCQPNDPMCRAGTAGVGRIERARLLRVLQRDDELRLSTEMQAFYDSAPWLPGPVEAELQRHALVENGLCRCWLEEYWKTSYIYPKEDLEIWNSTVYLRHYDRTLDNPPVQSAGQLVDLNIQLVDVASGKTKSLASYTNDKPLVIVAGSQS